MVLDGIVAKKILNTIIEEYFSSNLYVIILKDEAMIPPKAPSAFHFFCFDPTSKFRIESAIKEIGSDINDIFIILENQEEKKATFSIFRTMFKEARIITSLSGFEAYSEQNQVKKDEKNVFIDESDLIAGQFLSRLPNVPIIPKGFGLGQGEIMEISVPFGSVFAYRHIGSIQQKKYRIVGIYRQNKFLLSNFSLVIQPQDVVLVAGDPKMLNTIYKQIKSATGQFPSPFGRDIYVYIDMALQEKEDIIRDVKEALYFHSVIRSTELVVCVLNPSDFQTIDQIKCLCNTSDSVTLHFNYHNQNFIDQLKQDSEKKIGLVIVGYEIFSSRKNRRALFETNSPVLKTATYSLKDIKTSFVILNDEMNEGENISSVIFDLAIQTKTNVCVYDFDPDGIHQTNVIKDYETLGASLDKKITLIKTSTKNPIFYLNELNEPILQYIPFEKYIIRSRIHSIFSARSEEISPMFNKHPQIFIPISE